MILLRSHIQLVPLIIFAVTSTAFQQGSSIHVNSPINLREDSIYVNTPALAEDIKSALAIIRSVETLPSCNKMAASSLIHECATLDSPLQDKDRYIGPDTMLDSSKQLYAARLAVCELNDAQVPVPEACRSFLPSRKGAKRRLFRWRMNDDDLSASHETYPQYEELTSQDLNRCLSALHRDGSGQGWTSFSNNKKHAVAMCHAVRGDIEKDSHINLFKVLANSTVGIAEALWRSSSEWNDLVANFEKLKSSMQQFHVDLHRDSIVRQEDIANLWLQFKGTIQQELKDVSQTVDEVRSQVLEAGKEVESHKRLVQQAFNRTAHELSGLAAQNTKMLSAAAEQGTSLKEAMLWLQEMVQYSIGKVVQDTTQNIEHASVVAQANIHITEQLYAQSERAARLVASMEAASIRIQEISNSTVQQAEQANNSVMKMITAVSKVASLFQTTYDGILPQFQNCFWLVVFFLFGLSCWSMKVKDAISIVPLAMGTALVLTYIVRLQDILTAVLVEVPTWLVLAATLGGFGITRTIQWLLQRRVRKKSIALPRSTSLPVIENYARFHHPINDPRYYDRMLKR